MGCEISGNVFTNGSHPDVRIARINRKKNFK